MMGNDTQIAITLDATDLSSEAEHQGEEPSADIQPAPLHKDDKSALLERVFQRIYETSMADVPICNLDLKVEAIAFGLFETEWIGVLVTPWCMNIMMLPGPETEGWDEVRTGLKFNHILPAGRFEFITGKDEELGAYRMCSLFSPMFQFGDHNSAMQTAAISLQTLMNPDENDEPSEQEKEMNMIWRGEYPEEKLPDDVEDDETADSEEGSAQLEDGTQTSNDSSPKEPAQLSRRDFLRGSRKPAIETETSVSKTADVADAIKE